MKIIVCLDIKDGMMFNNRRQSKDSKIINDILKITKNKKIWVDEYSKELFKDDEKIIVDSDILSNASNEDYCFVEKQDLEMNLINELIIYRWDKVYPSDKRFSYEYANMKKKSSLEFSGNSHDKIIREVYVNEEI